MASPLFNDPFEPDGDGKGERESGAEPIVMFSKHRYAHEFDDDPMAAAGLARNAHELAVATLAAPDPGDDVEDHVARIHPRLGLSRSVGLSYCDIGTMLRMLPHLARILGERPFLPFHHLRTIANAVLPVHPDALRPVERELVFYLSPKRNRQALPGIRALANHLRRSIEAHDPDMRPVDPEEPSPRPKVEHLGINSDDPERTLIEGALAPDEGREFTLIIDAIARRHDCTRREALMHAVRGTAEVKVAINIYRDVAGGPAWMSGVG